MPEKLNYAGQMQPYIPKGNGDASGEYGNSDGSNKHFSNFKRPKEQRPNKYIESYVSGDIMYINNFLRKNQKLDQDEENWLKELDEATQYDIKENILYRSVDAKSIFDNINWQDYDNLKQYLGYGTESYDKGTYSQNLLNKAKKLLADIKGKEKQEKGFMSTTKDQDIALNWGGYSGSEMPMVLEIKTNPNTKGYDVSKFYEIDGDEQKEVLLSRNQKYKINDIGWKNGNIYAKVELL